MSSKIKLNAIAAMCNENNGIGLNKALPWNISEDHFYYLRVINTLQDKSKLNAVIYGRKTYENLPSEELPGDTCIKFVLSKTKIEKEINPKNDTKIFLCRDWDEIFKILNSNKFKDIIETVYVLGGSIVYEYAMKFDFFDKFYLTRIFKYFECDVMMKPKNFLSEFFNKVEDRNILEEKEKLFRVEYNKIIKDEKSGVEFIFEIYVKK